jgi:hypothetical protein
MARAAHKNLLAARLTDEFDPKVVGCARGPDAGEVPAQLMDAERRMSIIRIEQQERFDEPTLIGLRKAAECFEKLRAEAERPEGLYLARPAPRRRRLGYLPVSRSRGLSSKTRPALTSASARWREAIAAGVYAHRSSSGITDARRSWTVLLSTFTSSWVPSPMPSRRRTSIGKVMRPWRLTATTLRAMTLARVSDEVSLRQFSRRRRAPLRRPFPRGSRGERVHGHRARSLGGEARRSCSR